MREKLEKIRDELLYDQQDAWQERPDGLFEYRGCNGHGVESALVILDSLIAEQLTTEQKLDAAVEALERALHGLDAAEAFANYLCDTICMPDDSRICINQDITKKIKAAIKTIKE